MHGLIPIGAELITLLFLILPGSVFLWAFERMAGPVGVRGTDRLLRAVAWSAIILAASSAWFVRIGHAIATHVSISPWELWAAAVVITLIGPLLVGVGLAVASRIGVGAVIRTKLRWLAAMDPTPTAWDRVFGSRAATFVRARLKDGGRVGGYFGPKSFASSYPEAQDLYIEQHWWLADDGRFLQPIAGSGGLLIAREDVVSIEFLTATMARRRL